MLQSLNFLFNMGEYGYFVWPAYGIFFIVLFGLMIESKHSLKKAKKELATLTMDKTKPSDPGVIGS